jgi:hypothetical protein
VSYGHPFQRHSTPRGCIKQKSARCLSLAWSPGPCPMDLHWIIKEKQKRNVCEKYLAMSTTAWDGIDGWGWVELLAFSLVSMWPNFLL